MWFNYVKQDNVPASIVYNSLSLTYYMYSIGIVERVIKMTNIVYIRLKKKITVKGYKTITLQDIANITTTYENERKLGETPIYRLTKKDNNVVIIDSFIIIK